MHKHVIRTASRSSRWPHHIHLSGKRAFSNAVKAGNHSILAIETSCDDTSVAVLDIAAVLQHGQPLHRSAVRFHKTITANTEQYRGIHPLVALESHSTNAAHLVREACQHLRITDAAWQPTLVAATRGPGMRSNLNVGLNVAKGLAVAWDVPFIGVHHMQAHALTPRLVEASRSEDGEADSLWQLETIKPSFPYLSILVSGGHTMLLMSSSLTQHTTIASTGDIAIGDFIDKAARAILPPDLCRAPYGASLERFAFPAGEADYHYSPPRTRREEMEERPTPYHWTLPQPFTHSAAGKANNRMAYSFSGLASKVEQVMLPEQHSRTTNVHRSADDISINERRYMAKETMRVGFEHVISRVLLYLKQSEEEVSTIVISGGVASNKYLRHAVRAVLDARGYPHIQAMRCTEQVTQAH